MSEHTQVVTQKQQKISANPTLSFGKKSFRYTSIHSAPDRPVHEKTAKRDTHFGYDFSSLPVFSSMRSADRDEDIFDHAIQQSAAGPETETTQNDEEEADEEADEEAGEETGEGADEGTDEGTDKVAEQEREQSTSAGNKTSEPIEKNAPDSLPVGAAGKKPAKGTKKKAPAAKLIIKTIPKLWFFNKETPPNYAVSATLHTNTAGGTFNWTVSAKLHLSAANVATPVVTTLAESTAKSDSWIQVQHTDAAGKTRTAREKVTIRAPHDLKHLKNVDKPDATWGYDCQIHYSIQDQFGKRLPRSVPINEKWSGGVVSDFPGMNWRRGAEGSATVAPKDWFDHIQGETAGHLPAPVAPGAAGAATAVYHWPGDWRVGSLTIGKGSLVKSIVWQKNRGFARHL